MTDLSTLLHESAPTPRRPLDLDAIHARAQRRGGWRRWWLGGLAAVLAVPASAGILAPAHEGASTVDTDRRPPVVTPDEPPAPDGTAVGGDDGGATSDDRAGEPVAAGRPLAASTAGPDGSSPSPTTPVWSTAGDELDPMPADPYPLASACSVDDAGHTPGEERRCRFTASGRGGASLRSSGPTSPVGSSGRVLVTRNGQTTTHEVRYQSVRAGEFGAFACGGLIEPGDLVEVVLTTKSTPDDGTVTTLGAGEGWECWNN